jgi:hypothetical protein
MCFNCPANLTIPRQGLARRRMNPGKAGRRGEALRSRERGAVWMFKRAYFGDAAWVTRFGIVLVLGALAGLRAGCRAKCRDA